MTPRKLSWSLRGQYIAHDLGPEKGKNRYEVRVWDAASKKYRNRSWATESEARHYAQQQAARFALGQDRAGAVTITGTADEYLNFMKESKLDGKHIREAALLIQALKDFGVNDLKSPTIQRDSVRFFSQLKSRMKRTKTKGQELPLADATRVKLMAILSTYGNWLADHEPQYLSANPWRKLPRPRLDKKIPDVYLLEQARVLTSDKALAMEEGLLIAVLLYLGLRKEEATWLRWEHVMWDAARVQVRLPDTYDFREAELLGVDVKDIKRDKERLAILPPELAAILRPLAQDGHRYVFPDVMRKRSTSVERDAIHAHLTALNVPVRKRSVHLLRATCASVYIAARLDVIQLKAHLGHETLVTTDGYARAAGLFSEQCRGWAGELKFRAAPQLNSGANPGDNSQQEAPGPSDPEEELFVILPTTSDIFRQFEVVHEFAGHRIENPRVAGSIPAKATIQNPLQGSEIEQEADDLQAT